MSIKRRKLTYDMAKDVASQCKTRNDFQKKDIIEAYSATVTERTI